MLNNDVKYVNLFTGGDQDIIIANFQCFFDIMEDTFLL